MRLGMFDPASSVPYSGVGPSAANSPEHQQLALEAAQQGMVCAVRVFVTLCMAFCPHIAICSGIAGAVEAHQQRVAAETVKHQDCCNDWALGYSCLMLLHSSVLPRRVDFVSHFLSEQRRNHDGRLPLPSSVLDQPPTSACFANRICVTP